MHALRMSQFFLTHIKDPNFVHKQSSSPHFSAVQKEGRNEKIT